MSARDGVAIDEELRVALDRLYPTGDPQGGTRQNRQDHEQLQRPPERQPAEDSGRIRSSTVYL